MWNATRFSGTTVPGSYLSYTIVPVFQWIDTPYGNPSCARPAGAGRQVLRISSPPQKKLPMVVDHNRLCRSISRVCSVVYSSTTVSSLLSEWYRYRHFLKAKGWLGRIPWKYLLLYFRLVKFYGTGTVREMLPIPPGGSSLTTTVDVYSTVVYCTPDASDRRRDATRKGKEVM